MDKRHVVDALRQLGKKVADPAPALPVLPECPVAALAVTWLRSEELHLTVGIKRLALPLGEFGFVVPCIDMAESARTENLYHCFCLGGVVQARAAIWSRLSFVEHGGKRNAAQASTEFPKEISATDHAVMTVAGIWRVHKVCII